MTDFELRKEGNNSIVEKEDANVEVQIQIISQDLQKAMSTLLQMKTEKATMSMFAKTPESASYQYRSDIDGDHALWTQSEKVGVFTSSGKEIIPAIYDDILHDEDYYYVLEGHSEYIFDRNGHKLEPTFHTVTEILNDDTIPASSEWPLYVTSPFQPSDSYRYIGALSPELLLVERGNAQGVLDTKGNEFFTVGEYESIKLENGYFIASKDGLVSALDMQKGVTIAGYEGIRAINDLFIVKRDGLVGALTQQGKEFIPIQYDGITMSEDYIYVRKGKKKGIYDLEGKNILPAKFQEINIYSNYIIGRRGRRTSEVYTLEGNKLLPDAYTYINFKNERFEVRKESAGRLHVFDSTGTYLRKY